MADLTRIAVVLAAHGDRGSVERNAVLRAHAARLRERNKIGAITHGVLNGEPALPKALQLAENIRPDLVLVYPFFMSGGYFVKKVIPERMASVALSRPVRALEPLGLDPALPDVLFRRSLETAAGAGLAPEQSRLLIAAHGSKIGRASAERTEAIAETVRAKASFYEVTTAFIEEPPFIADALRAADRPIIVAGLFSGDGMHGHDDLGEAMREATVPCVYTRPIGGDAEVSRLIEAAIERALVQ
jgi:sirohydrochlorin cobaltochelatase